MDRDELIALLYDIVERVQQTRPYSQVDRLEKPITPVELMRALWEIKRNA